MSFGQISITAIGTPYNENFDSMGVAGTTFVTGGTAIRVGGTGTVGATLTMAVDDGSLASGNVYNLGTSAAGERAFGTIESGSTVPAFGASFINNTGSAISTVSISAIMEQWRTGGLNTLNEVVLFSYSLDATNLSNGTWIPVTALNLSEILTTTSDSVAVNGNLPGNQASISASISSLTWANGTT